MSRLVLVLGPNPLGLYGAARPRIEAITSAFKRAGWTADLVAELGENVPASGRRLITPAIVVRLATRVGLAGDIRPARALAALNRVRALPSDALFVVSVPPFSLVTLATAHKGPTIVDYRDVLSFASRRTVTGRLLGPWERVVVRRYVAGVTLAGSARLVNRVVHGLGLSADRVLHLPNGVNRSDVDGAADERPNRSGPVRLAYAGELYGYADFRPISRMVSDMPAGIAELHVVTPTDRSSLRRYIGSDDQNVIVHPPMARRDLYQFLRGCDLGLIALTREYPYLDSVPAKYFDYLAAGLDIVYVGPSSPALLEEPGSESVRVVTGGADQLRQVLLDEHAHLHERRDRSARSFVVDRAESATALVQLAERLTRS